MLPGEHEVILVVEDSPFHRKVIGDVLRAGGYSPAFAENGLEALEVLEKESLDPCLILTDLNMPEMDGYALIDELQKDEIYKHIPVLVCTDAKSVIEDVQKLKDLGASGYISKNVPPEYLLFRIRQATFARDSQRRGERIIITIPMKYKINSSLFYAYSFNISESGIFVRTTDPPPVGKEATLFFNLPKDEEEFEIGGRIVRNVWEGELGAGPPGFGVEFTKMKDRDLERIKTFVKEYLEKEYELYLQ